MKRKVAVILAFVSLGIVCGASAVEPRPAEIKDEAKWKELQTGAPVLLMRDDDAGEGGTKRTLAGILIDAPAKIVWDIVCNKEDAPNYVKNLKRAKILTRGRDDDGVAYFTVEQEMKLGLLPGTFVYTCKHRLRPHTRIDFKRTVGDLRDIEGFWQFVPLEDGKKTLLIYQLHIDPGMMIPGAIVRSSLKKSLPEALIGIGVQAALLKAQTSR